MAADDSDAPDLDPNAAPERTDFVRELVQRDIARRDVRRTGPDPVPTRTERLPPHRPRQGDPPRLRARPASSAAPASSASTTPTPTPRTRRSSRGSSPTCVGSATTPTTSLYASDYFEQLYEWAELLVIDGKAYVDDQDIDTIRAQRGGYGKPGIESPCRDRLASRRTSTCSAGCAPASSPTARTCCAPRSTCSTRTCSSATR